MVQEIGRTSARMFNDVGMPQITAMLWTAEDLAAHREAGRLWVITGLDDCPAGFLITEMVDGCLHVEQVSVNPGSARRGLGRALLDHAAHQAAAAGVRAVTLTTFAQVPCNAPYYARCRSPAARRRRGHARAAGHPAPGSRVQLGPVAAGLHAPRPVNAPAAAPVGACSAPGCHAARPKTGAADGRTNRPSAYHPPYETAHQQPTRILRSA